MQMRLAMAMTLAAAVAHADDKPTQVVNLTATTIVGLRLSHAGSGEYGDDLVIGRTSGVRRGESLTISDVPSGHYDVAVKLKGGGSCFVRDVKVVVGEKLSLAEKALVACSKK